MNLEEITEEDLKAYETVRVSGITNMCMLNVVSDLTGLDRETLLVIMENYGELLKKYPNVRK